MDKHRLNLLLPIDIWQRIKALAERNRRPVTQEIIRALELHLATSDFQISGTKKDLTDPEKVRVLLLKYLEEASKR